MNQIDSRKIKARRDVRGGGLMMQDTNHCAHTQGKNPPVHTDQEDGVKALAAYRACTGTARGQARGVSQRAGTECSQSASRALSAAMKASG